MADTDDQNKSINNKVDPSVSGRARMLFLQKKFWKTTNEEHSFSMRELREYLSEHGIEAGRRTIASDIEALSEFHINEYNSSGIEKRSDGRYATYALGTRSPTTEELLVMADIVQSAKFLTKEQALHFVAYFKRLAFKDDEPLFNACVETEGRLHVANEQLPNSLKVLRTALADPKHRKITFKYTTKIVYDSHITEIERHNGKEYSIVPMHLVYVNNLYYFVGYDEHAEEGSRIRHYRVDRMKDAVLSEEVYEHSLPEIDTKELCLRTFGMYKGDKITVYLTVDEEVFPAFCDRFGDWDNGGVSMVPNWKGTSGPKGRLEKIPLAITVSESRVFYGWLTQFAGKVTVDGPASFVENYRDFLKEAYGSMNPEILNQ